MASCKLGSTFWKSLGPPFLSFAFLALMRTLFKSRRNTIFMRQNIFCRYNSFFATKYTFLPLIIFFGIVIIKNEKRVGAMESLNEKIGAITLLFYHIAL